MYKIHSTYFSLDLLSTFLSYCVRSDLRNLVYYTVTFAEIRQTILIITSSVIVLFITACKNTIIARAAYLSTFMNVLKLCSVEKSIITDPLIQLTNRW